MRAERMSKHEGGFRLESGGLLIDRDKPIAFFLNGESLLGWRGDTLASALLAAGRTLTPPSPRYGRPRALYTAGAEEPNAIYQIEDRRGALARRPATMTPLRPGLKAFAAGLPAANAGGIRGRAAPLLDRFSVFSPKAATPSEGMSHDEGAEEELNFFTDVLVIGGGVAGIAAAKAAVASGARTLLVEQAAHFGGRALGDGGKIGGRRAQTWIEKEIEALKAAPEATLRRCAEALTLGDVDGALILERPAAPGPLRRLWRARAQRVVLATGAVERPMVFVDNDLPGVMTAAAMRDYLTLYGAAAGQRIALFANNDDAYLTAIRLAEAGLEIAAIVDPRAGSEGDLPRRAAAMGLPIRSGSVVARAVGAPRPGGRIEAVEIAALRRSGRLGAAETVSCDALAVSGGWSPALALWTGAGGPLAFDDTTLMLKPDPSQAEIETSGGAGLAPAGAAAGAARLAEAVASGLAAGRSAAKAAGFTPARLTAPKAEEAREEPILPLWFAPGQPAFSEGERHFVDLASDLTVEEVERAARGGAESLDALGAAVGLPGPLGAFSATQALALIGDVRNAPLDALARRERSRSRAPAPPRPPLFQPERITPMQGWHEAHGAVFAKEADWRTPLCFLRQSGPDGEMEDEEEASVREIRLARRGVGAVDASSLAKFLIRGPEAARLLDEVFAEPMSGLGAGRCGVGVIAREDGPALAEAVAARLDDQGWRVYAPAAVGEALASLLRESAVDRRAYVADVTDVWGHIALVGPKSRALLERLCELDLSDEALPPLGWIDAALAGCPVRLLRLAQGGGLGYEIAVPASAALSFWRRLFEAGETLGLQPIGAAARDALRIERGRPAPQQEADGKARPADLGAAASGGAAEADRWALVGLEPEDADQPLPEGAALFPGDGGGVLRYFLASADGADQPLGRVTSSCWSPTLGRAIALGLVAGGAARFGETVHLHDGDGRLMRSRVVRPRFVEPDEQKDDGWRPL